MYPDPLKENIVMAIKSFETLCTHESLLDKTNGCTMSMHVERLGGESFATILCGSVLRKE